MICEHRQPAHDVTVMECGGLLLTATHTHNLLTRRLLGSSRTEYHSSHTDTLSLHLAVLYCASGGLGPKTTEVAASLQAAYSSREHTTPNCTHPMDAGAAAAVKMMPQLPHLHRA
jgi:hypothetical protein